MDVTEFVVQIVDASSNSVLATIDSVGVDTTNANDTSNPPYYGTSVATWCRSASLPQGVLGQTVYVRVVPKRYGSTPYGLTASRIGSRMSRSLLYGCSETELASNQSDSLLSLFYVQDCNYSSPNGFRNARPRVGVFGCARLVPYGTCNSRKHCWVKFGQLVKFM